jgi:alanine-alpha-ketoisovalerate/valine-pyruvate aminotransferase
MKFYLPFVLLISFISCSEPAPEPTPEVPIEQKNIGQEMIDLRCEVRKFQKLIEPLSETKKQKDALLKEHAGNPAKLAEIEKEFSDYDAKLDSIRKRSEEISALMKEKMAEYFRPAQGDTALKRQLDLEIKRLFDQPCPE